jgi:type VI secretion system protein VasG
MGAIRPILNDHLKPALLARMTVAPYYTLDADALKEIVRIKLNKLSARLAANHRMRLTYSDTAVDQIAARCTDVETGARNVDFILNLTVLPQLSREILAHMSSAKPPADVRLEIAEGGDFQVAFGA